jgi:hypothetical protein
MIWYVGMGRIKKRFVKRGLWRSWDGYWMDIGWIEGGE